MVLSQTGPHQISFALLKLFYIFNTPEVGGRADGPTHHVAALVSRRLARSVVQRRVDARLALRALVEVERLQVDEIDAPAAHHRNTDSTGTPR